MASASGEPLLPKGKKRPKNSQSNPQSSEGPTSEFIMEFLDVVLEFSSSLLCQRSNPLREGLMLDQVDTPASPTTTHSERDSQVGEEEDDVSLATTSPSPGPQLSWQTQNFGLVSELERLSMWKFDIKERKLDKIFTQDSPILLIVSKALLSIAEVLIDLPDPESISSCSDNELKQRLRKLEKNIDKCRATVSAPESTSKDADHPFTNTRSRSGSTVEIENKGEGALSILKDDISRLVRLVDTMVELNTRMRLGKRSRKASPVTEDISQKRTRTRSNTKEQLAKEITKLELSNLDQTTPVLRKKPHKTSSHIS